MRGPESGWDWLWSRIKDRAVLGRLGLCLLGVLAMLVVIPSWWVPFPYRESQLVPNGIAASIDFEVVDERQTFLLRENAGAKAPFVFENDPTKLDPLPGNFQAGLTRIAQTETLDELEEEIREDFGLVEDHPAAREGFRTPAERFQALRQAVAAEGQLTPEDRISELQVNLSNFIAPLRKAGIIAPRIVREQNIGRDSQLLVLTSKAAGNPPDAATTDLQPELVNPTSVNLTDQLSEAGVAGSKWGAYPVSFQAIRPLVETWLHNQQPETLRFSAEKTSATKTAAIAEVGQVLDSFAAGDSLVPPGEWLDSDDIALLSAEYEVRKQQSSWSDLSLRVAVVFGMLVVLAVLNGYYLSRNEPNVIKSVSRLIVYLTAIVGAAALGRLLSFDPWRAEVIPLIATVMVFAIAYNQVFAALSGFTLCLVVTLATTMHLSQFVVLMTTAATAVLPLTRVSSRTTLIKSGFLAGLAYLSSSLGVAVLESQDTAQLLGDYGLLTKGVKGAAWCLLAGYFVWGSLPFIESTFGVLTDISLLEMSDPSHPLLQELVQRAPGTYNHSISVASIAETAAESIGANGLLVRVGAYFHDIGKMLKPQYFIENVQSGTQSRHDQLAPAMSTLIIIGHVKDGVDLAEQYNLPQQFIDFIEQHHGTTLVEYFYHEATRQAGESLDHKSDAEESSFRYPGPKPQTKEAAVMMIADSCESASRTLTDPTAKRLETLVHELAMKKLMDGQFDECSLTLSEIHTIEKSLVKSLIGIYHGRIKYPEARTA